MDTEVALMPKQYRISKRIVEAAQLDAQKGAYLDAIFSLGIAAKQLLKIDPGSSANEESKKLLKLIEEQKKNYLYSARQRASRQVNY